MTDNEIIYTIWGTGPLKKQFDVAPYSLNPDELKILQGLDRIKSSVNAKGLVTLSSETAY
jgi:hypothetical protein